MSKSHMMTHSERADMRRRNGMGDPRSDKKFFNQMYDMVYRAFLMGDALGMTGRPYVNPFPAGKRHDAFKRGYKLADPLGDWHGRNE